MSQPHTLITCHANADFDAFASLIAAHKLYPQSILLFPGTQEKSLHTFYAESASHMYAFIKAENIVWDAITRLILVDTRQYARVPHVHTLLARDNVEISIWDHHPASQDDIHATTTHIQRVGATTTLLCEALQNQGISLFCEDATIIGMGIYADTGSFTFASTTKADFYAAAWLLQQGMDTNVIVDCVAHELTSAHVHALNTLIESATTYTIGNIPIAMAEASMEDYLGDFAFLAHKLMEIERFDVLFAFANMGDNVLVVARSRLHAVNVGQICTALGGGGHSYAASVTLRHKSLPESRDAVLQQLYSRLHTHKSAKDYMTSPALGIDANRSIKEAEELMMRFGLKAVPVFETNTRHCVGILDAHTASRAVSHGLDALPLDIYMLRTVQTLSPDASLDAIMHVIIGTRQRLIPIVEADSVIGVVTRSDLIKLFVEEASNVPHPLHESHKERNITKIMRDKLHKRSFALLECAGVLGDRLGLPVYAVGGFVRDLLLEYPNQDIDIVVEGNGIAYARELARELGGRVREHQKFLTAIVIFDEVPSPFAQPIKRRIDVATARLEYYEYPAALPTVELSSIKMDLYRRDFTINTLAIRLNKNTFGRLVDYFGGQRDIRDAIIRALHTLSFVEDPTRCLRAVRFEQRYGFRIGSNAEKLIKNVLNLKLIDKLSGWRVFQELKLIFMERNPVACLCRLDVLGLLGAIHPSLTLNPTKIHLLQSIKEMYDWYQLLYYEERVQPWILYVLGMCRGHNFQEIMGVLARCELPLSHRDIFMRAREHIRTTLPKLEKWQKNSEPVSQLHNLCRDIIPEGILYLMARTEDELLRKSLSRYITLWRREKLEIKGTDILAMGIAQGPLVGKILRDVLAAKLDGLAETQEAQLHLAGKLARQYTHRETLANC